MDHLQRFLILLMVTGIPAAAPPFFASSPDLCLTAGSLTYRVSPGAAAADLRVRIEPRAAHPDLRIRLVDGIESADFAVVDDVGATHQSACASAGLVKTVRVVSDAGPADITLSLSRDDADADLRLFVLSMRFGHREAAALFAAMRHYENPGRVVDSAEDDSLHESW
jgi:hypothetical protein